MTQYRSDTNILLSTNKTIYEVFRLSDRITPSGTATDAFGRLRTSQPFTLFDSQNRYQINEKFATSNTGTANANTSYVIHQSTVDLNIGTSSTDSVKRETNRVFAYQPGKSLLVMNTFAMANAQANLTQRVGYFNNENGIFVERSNTSTYLVLRSNSSGTITETKVEQANWNKDTFDGSANSYATSAGHGGLNLSKTNIFWLDVEWLGVGDVRCGFVVDGLLIPAHIFHNDNVQNHAYMSTACLPIRYEIFNTGNTSNNSTLKQICSTVISEGGYELQGRPRTVGSNPNTSYDLTTSNTYYPVLSIKLKSEKPDAIVLPKGIHIAGLSSGGSVLRYKIVSNTAPADGNWISAGTDSSVLYSLNSNTYTGGTDLVSGYISITNQASTPINLSDDIFEYQLERNGLTNQNTVFTVAVSGQKNGDNVFVSLDWEEVV